MELKVTQGYNILTLHILPSQTGILDEETIALDQDVHVWFKMNIYSREYLWRGRVKELLYSAHLQKYLSWYDFFEEQGLYLYFFLSFFPFF